MLLILSKRHGGGVGISNHILIMIAALSLLFCTCPIYTAMGSWSNRACNGDQVCFEVLWLF